MSTRVKQQSHSGISVTTLNYSGTINSPFEYYTINENDKFEELSKKFEQNVEQWLKSEGRSYEGFKWSIGSIDKVFKIGRYTPIYDKSCGF